jgi:hypothetical protein
MKRRLFKIGLPAALALIVTAVAFAWFTASGSGTGAASADNPTVAITIGPGTPTAGLYPGGDADVAATLTNANPYAVHIDQLSLDTSAGTNGFSVDGGHSGCNVSTLGYTTQSAGWTVPKKVGATDGTLDVDLASAISMSPSAASACQGATFTVHLKVAP